ncbi:MAG: flavodoxin family protein [Actinobacteria bacterium]|nr:flavodoxin family protein [Actinomycetota bacterium]MBU4489328.1 flavodoxin family protein [Actinomycetota bacterium]MCG2795280.1 flavodoxin family protein [Actinomycetes bacterium]
MFVTGINGSPDREGNTAFLVGEVLKACRELGAQTEIIHVMDALEGQERPYCTACGSPCPEICHREANLAGAYDIVRKADALVVGSPVYFGTVSAQLKAFWDKSRNLRGEKALVGIPGGAVSVAAARFGGQETTVRAIQDIMLIHGMRVVGDASMGTGGGHQGVCAQRPSREDDFACGRARVLAEGLIEAIST